MTSLVANISNKNVQAFLLLITKTEGTDLQGTPYNELYGYDNFTDFSKHPNILVNKGGYKSTAAGRYQINKPTYDSLGMKNMKPETQDLAAIQLLKRCGAYPYVISGDFKTAVTKAAPVWASLPLFYDVKDNKNVIHKAGKSYYGQPVYATEKVLIFLKSVGVTLANPAIPVIIAIVTIFLISKF